MTDVPDGLKAVEEQYAALLSFILNLPSFAAACVALLFFSGQVHQPDWLARVLGWSIVLAPFLTGGAVAHAIWAGRVARIGKRPLHAIRATTALGVLAFLVAAWTTLRAFAV